MKNQTDLTSDSNRRVVALDAHPDTFTAALLRGPTPAAAIVEKVFNKIPLSQLRRWAQKHTRPEDVLVLEASGNSFQIVRTLATVQRQALVLESCRMGKLKEVHANNDRISAVRIGKAYLAGTAGIVWVPDLPTQERRDWFHADRKAVKRATQVHNRLLSYLSDREVRLPAGTDLLADQTKIFQARNWSAREKQVIEGLLMELRHAQEQQAHWQSLIAQEVLADPLLLSIVRLCGVRDKVAFALGAIIGDIHRFDTPRKLVSYLGLHPAFDDSGEGQWSGGIGGHGRRDLRSLLIEAAHSVLRSNDPLAQWGKKLLARKSSVNLAVAAIARKLAVAVWYLMMGRWQPLETIADPLAKKVGKIISRVGTKRLAQSGQTRKGLREAVYQRLKTGRTYVLHPPKQFTPKPKKEERPATLLEEYGLR